MKRIHTIRVLTAYQDNKLVVTTSLFALLCLALGSLSYALVGNRIIESIYNGESLEFLNRMVANHRLQRPEVRTLEHYFHLGRLLFSRVFLTWVGLQLLVVALLKRRTIYETLNSYFTAVTSPLNLAIFRVVLFFTIFEQVNPASVAWFSRLPQEFRIVPAGSSWLIQYLPIDPVSSTIGAGLLTIVSFSAMIGFFSRTSALLTTLLAIYVLGIPQFYGKVNHYHHLVWFAAILATSRCSDVLSVDAVISVWRRAEERIPTIAAPATVYALPLRFVWLLIGIAYFFAGFWKLWSTGFDWFLTENMKLIMYQKWTELGGWTPLFRIDQYPALYKLSALAAVVIELSFIFLIFSRRLRLLAPLGGLAFHSSTFLFMQISFQSLLRCYVAFLRWDAIFERLGRIVFTEKLHLVYDGNCKLCRRTIGTLGVFDVFGRITYINALDQGALKRYKLDHLDSAALLTDIHAITSRRTWLGFEAYRATASRIPMLWPILPFLYLWPIPALARRIYRTTADTRSCSIAAHQASGFTSEEARAGPGVLAIAATGCLLTFTTGYAGITDSSYAWPFASYPNFAGYARSEIELPQVTAQTPDGELIYLDERSFGNDLSVERFWGLVGQLSSSQDERLRFVRLQALWRLWAQNEMKVKNAHVIILSRLTLVTVPERHSENPVRRELLYEARISDLKNPPNELSGTHAARTEASSIVSEGLR